MMFRQIIKAEMKRQGISTHALALRVANRIPRRTVYNYLSGISDLGGERVAILCKEIGLTLKRSTVGRK